MSVPKGSSVNKVFARPDIIRDFTEPHHHAGSPQPAKPNDGPQDTYGASTIRPGSLPGGLRGTRSTPGRTASRTRPGSRVAG